MIQRGGAHRRLGAFASESTRLEVAAAVLRVAADTERTFYELAAAEQIAAPDAAPPDALEARSVLAHARSELQRESGMVLPSSG